jgi:uncharacterized Zn finger protein (UPF0148 family)
MTNGLRPLAELCMDGCFADKFTKMGRIMCPAHDTKVLPRSIEPNGQK